MMGPNLKFNKKLFHSEMGSCKLTRLMLQMIKQGGSRSIGEIKATPNARSRHLQRKTCLNCGIRASHKDESRTELPGEVSIYKVPAEFCRVEPDAYNPRIISIGPYHHGAQRLQDMEAVKWQFFNRLFDPRQPNAASLTQVYEAVEEYEEQARSYYSETIGICKEKFVEMMILDGCFILQLFRQLKQPDSKDNLDIIKRWMIPFLRRDLIMLENQLPLVVLEKLHNLTKSKTTADEDESLKELALHFFRPLIEPRNEKPIEQSILRYWLDHFSSSILHTIDSFKSPIQSVQLNTVSTSNYRENPPRHLLDLFRSDLLPTVKERKREPHIMRSAKELKEAFIKIRKRDNCKPLDLSFKARRFRRHVLEIPPLHINDYNGTLYRNLVAFEQCHSSCKPDVTRYLFFLDGLVDSEKDVELLHYAGVVQHSLGNKKQVAALICKLCKDVAPDVQESYLHQVVGGIHTHCSKFRYRLIASLVHNYFSNIWVGASTVFAILLIYLTVVQTSCGIADTKMLEHGFWSSLKKSFLAPVAAFKENLETDHPDGFWASLRKNKLSDDSFLFVQIFLEDLHQHGFSTALRKSFAFH
ncbi:UPF0481 protein At3g47200-like [Diospyros lotus]|uniref:UPF0481 protein At3g47200-like n=1 Tax=Diospyros lotus TaxID=55363 RepID=UPI002253FE54|nr:UPF0481 protein At3g47200-like [Diospyros lotus]